MTYKCNNCNFKANNRKRKNIFNKLDEITKKHHNPLKRLQKLNIGIHYFEEE